MLTTPTEGERRTEEGEGETLIIIIKSKRLYLKEKPTPESRSKIAMYSVVHNREWINNQLIRVPIFFTINPLGRC